MRTKKAFVFNRFAFAAMFWLAACNGEPSPSINAQVTNITERQQVTGEITQTKTFDQCDSSSVFKTSVQFSESNIKTNQEELVLGLEGSGSGKVYGAIEVEIKGSIQKHFSETTQQGESRGENLSIEVPAHTKQEYTFIWQETRREGTVEYEENGQKKSIDFSYRVGLELVRSSGKDIPCDSQDPTTEATESTQPTASTFRLGFRKAEPSQVAAGLTSLWDTNNIHVKDILSPGTKSYSGNAEVGVEYVFPVYWCATTESILIDNRNNIKTEFFLDGVQIPDTYILVYGFTDEDGWRCINTSIMLSGWVSGEEYVLQIIREFKTSIYDGKTSYPAGRYIYELNVSSR
ncbi:MAG: hypothetical protein IPP55_14470 [Anaerolineales bacterium]|nr:hypothetical protein [Anaerolineales bacterium]